MRLPLPLPDDEIERLPDAEPERPLVDDDGADPTLLRALVNEIPLSPLPTAEPGMRSGEQAIRATVAAPRAARRTSNRIKSLRGEVEGLAAQKMLVIWLFVNARDLRQKLEAPPSKR